METLKEYEQTLKNPAATLADFATFEAKMVALEKAERAAAVAFFDGKSQGRDPLILGDLRGEYEKAMLATKSEHARQQQQRREVRQVAGDELAKLVQTLMVGERLTWEVANAQVKAKNPELWKLYLATL